MSQIAIDKVSIRNHFRSAASLGKWPLVIFALAVSILIARTTTTFIVPVLYAEDGIWASQVSQEGLLVSLGNGRSDYFVAPHVFLIWVSLKVSQIITGSQFLILPQVISATSTLVVSFVILVIVYAFPTKSNLSRLGMTALFSLLPFGLTQNETLGRILQLSHLLPAFAVALVLLREKTKTPLTLFALDFFLVLSALGNPAIVVFPVFLFLREIVRSKNIGVSLQKFGFLLGTSFVILFFTFTRPKTPSAFGSDYFHPENFIKTFIGRALLYPFTHAWYSSLNDFLAILILSLAVIGLLWLRRSIRNSNVDKANLDSAFICLILYWLTMVISRSGLTQFTTSYEVTIPDRYYWGINLLALFVFFGYLQLPQKPKRMLQNLFVYTLMFLVSIQTVFNIQHIIHPSADLEWSAPMGSISLNSSTYSSQFCRAAVEGNLATVNIAPFPEWKIKVAKSELAYFKC